MSAEPPRPPVPPAPPTGETQPLNAPLRPRQPQVAPAERVVERVPPPEYPPEERRWDSPWPAILLGLCGLIAGGLIGYAVGNNNENASTQRGAQPAITRTVTHTNTVVQPKVVERSNTVTAPAAANPVNEERRTEAESRLRKAERENEELRRQLEGN
jgi:hypothetical protein